MQSHKNYAFIFSQIRNQYYALLTEEEKEDFKTKPLDEYKQKVSHLKKDVEHAIKIFDEVHTYRTIQQTYLSLKLIQDIHAHFKWEIQDKSFSTRYNLTQAETQIQRGITPFQ